MFQSKRTVRRLNCTVPRGGGLPRLVAHRLARVFIHATTDVSTNSEDILPQDGGPDCDYSLFFAFSSLFPKVVRDISAEGACLIPL